MILNPALVQRVLDQALYNGADFAELYLENTFQSDLGLKDSKPSEGMIGRLYGAGLRLHYGLEEIYTYTNDLSEENLLGLAKTAALALKGPRVHLAKASQVMTFDSIHTYKTFPWEVSKEKKISHLKRFDQAARQRSSSVSQVLCGLRETVKEVQVSNSEGLTVTETRQYITSRVEAIVEQHGLKEAGYERMGSLASSDFLDSVHFEQMAEMAVDRALQNLKADFAPAGEMPVVVDKGFGGVIFHEACGHGLETTAVAKGASVFCDRLEQKIAEDCVTAIDDGTIANSYGSLSIDDEGAPTQKTVLIEKGVLKSYLVDRLGAAQTGYARTGSGRRESYRFSPTSRMRNTFFAPGSSSLEEMIKDVDYGLYAKTMGGGSVTPGTGAYNFAVGEAFLIKNGRLDKPVKGASLIGTGIETIGRIQKVGSDLLLAPGTCGSISGQVPVTVGQPPLLVSKLTVGGRA